MAPASTGPLRRRLTADDIRNYDFPARFGRPDMDDVRIFRERVAAEVEQLALEARDARRFPAAEVAAREATRILAGARRTGEGVIATAQAQARDVTLTARDRAERLVADGHALRDGILDQARGQAEAVVAEAAARFPVDAQAQVAYLQSFAELLTGQLRSAIEVLEARRPGMPPVTS
jgi:hypothetical protein